MRITSMMVDACLLELSIEKRDAILIFRLLSSDGFIADTMLHIWKCRREIIEWIVSNKN